MTTRGMTHSTTVMIPVQHVRKRNVQGCGDWANKGGDFQWWNSLVPVTERMSLLNMPRLTVTYNMGWQQQSSGNKYTL